MEVKTHVHSLKKKEKHPGTVYNKDKLRKVIAQWNLKIQKTTDYKKHDILLLNMKMLN